MAMVRAPQTQRELVPFTIGTTREAHWIKLFLYGPYGSGKTTLAASAIYIPKMRDVLFLDAEAGEMAIPDELLEDRIRITDYATVARVYEFLRLHVRYRDAGDDDRLLALEQRLRPDKEITKPKKYYTVIIDTLTEIQTYLMYQLLQVDRDNWDLDTPPDTAEYKEWNQSSEMIMLLVRSFRDLPMNVIIVCSEQEVTDDHNRILKRPGLPGKLALKVQGFPDLVGYLDAKTNADGNTVRRLWLQAGRASFSAKHRFRGIDVNYLDEPTLEALLALDEESQRNANTATAQAPARSAANRPAQARSSSGAGAGGRGAVRGRPVPGGRPAGR